MQYLYFYPKCIFYHFTKQKNLNINLKIYQRAFNRNVYYFAASCVVLSIIAYLLSVTEVILPARLFLKSGPLQENITFSTQNEASKICPEHENLTLLGTMNVQAILKASRLVKTHLSVVSQQFSSINGGHWVPPDCEPLHKVAIIIPFRDRLSHLAIFLYHLLPILQRQKLEFYIIVVEQNDKQVFNKGRLFNSAFLYAESLNISCVIFHDVDLLPETDHLFYGCSKVPLHLGAYVNTLNYEIVRDWTTNGNLMVGGVLSMTVEHFRAVNGFSNEFWGWGGEDDDMGIRIIENNLTIVRPNKSLRYTMIEHEDRVKKSKNISRFKMLNAAWKRLQEDGLNSLSTSVSQVQIKKLYHHLLIDIGKRTQSKFVSS